MPTNGELLVRIDERLERVQADVHEIKDVVGADHDALLVLTGKQATDVATLEGKIRNTNIWQGLGSVIGTVIGSIFGFANRR